MRGTRIVAVLTAATSRAEAKHGGPLSSGRRSTSQGDFHFGFGIPPAISPDSGRGLDWTHEAFLAQQSRRQNLTVDSDQFGCMLRENRFMPRFVIPGSQRIPLSLVGGLAILGAAALGLRLSFSRPPGSPAAARLERGTVRRSLANTAEGSGRSPVQSNFRPGAAESETIGGEREPPSVTQFPEVIERLEAAWTSAVMRARESVVTLEFSCPEKPPETRLVATGVVIDERGFVISIRVDPPAAAATVPEGAKLPSPIVARDVAGRCYLARWVAADPETGVTLLRIAPGRVRPIEVLESELRVGAAVVVVGNPLGLEHSASRGQIAGIDRTIGLGARELGGLLQVQAPLYPGDSGAVVADLRGRWAGLIRSGLGSPSGDRSGRDNQFGFAIPARSALWVADQLQRWGRVERAYLGVRLDVGPDVEPLPPPTAEDHSETPTSEANREAKPQGTTVVGVGALVRDVIPDTPAAAAGLQVGDLIVGVEGRSVRSPQDLIDRLDWIPAFQRIHLDVLRGRHPARKPITASLTTGRRPIPKPQPSVTFEAPNAVPSPTLSPSSQPRVPDDFQTERLPHGPADSLAPLPRGVAGLRSERPADAQVVSAVVSPPQPAQSSAPSGGNLLPFAAAQAEGSLPKAAPSGPTDRPSEAQGVEPTPVSSSTDELRLRLERLEHRLMLLEASLGGAAVPGSAKPAVAGGP